MKRTTLPMALALGTALLLAACSQDPEPAPPLPPVAPAATTAPAAVATTTAPAGGAVTGAVVPTAPSGNINAYTTKEGGDGVVTFQVAQSADLGGYVVDGEGFTLYRFNPDTPNPSKSTCNAGCAITWPPVLATHKVQYIGLQRKNIGTLHREDGSVQMNIGKWPVYRFSKDAAPGQINGQGVDGNWFAVAPDGSKAGVK